MAGFGDAAVKILSYNSCRRFLPTAADMLQSPLHVRQGIGNWVDGCADSKKDPSAAIPMCVTYSDARAVSSGAAKLEVLQELFVILEGCPAAAEVLNGGVITKEALDISWEDVDLAFRSKKQFTSASASSSSTLPTTITVKVDRPRASQGVKMEQIEEGGKPKRKRLDRRPSYKDRGRGQS